MRIMTAVLSTGFLFICLAMPAVGATVSGLYEAQVPVAGEDVASRNQAIGEALGRVLIKVTGRDPAPGAADLVPQAARYVQQFRYRRELSAQGEPQTSLWVRFDKIGLDRELRGRSLPLWGSSRPGVLVWLGAEVAGRRELIGVETGLGAALYDAAAARGLPVQLPLLDLEDRARLTSADLWSDYEPVLRQASERYSQSLILSGRLRRVAPNHWDSRWTFYEAGASEVIEVSAADASEVIALAVGQVTELLASRYAPAGAALNGPETVRVRVIGVAGLHDYARTLKLIGEREVVERVAVRSVDGDTLLLEVLARGGRDALAQVLGLAGDLSREPDPLPPPVPLPGFQPSPSPQLQPPATTQPVSPDTQVAPAVEPAAPPAPGMQAPHAAEQVAAPFLPQAEIQPEPPVDLVYRLNH